MIRDFLKTTAMAAGAVVAFAGTASAATILIDFEGSTSGSPSVYVEDGFTFASNSSGGVTIANCPPTGGCLQLNNNETITATYAGGLFDLMSFTFRSPGSGGDLEIGSNVAGTTQTITESLSGNDMQLISFPTQYNGILSFSWTNEENGSGRVDNISFNVPSPVPLPAAGWLLIGCIGGLAALKRRKKASA